MYRQTESALARVGQQLSQLEKRDWELWVIVSLTGVLVATGLLAILFPAAFLKQDNIHFELTVSRALAVGLIALLVLLNTYLVSKRLEIRRVREELISSTIQRELVQQQSFTDPLTEIYNRRSLPKLTQTEQDLLSHIQDGYQLETDSLGGNPILRRLTFVDQSNVILISSIIY